MLTSKIGHIVGAQFIGAPPIYRLASAHRQALADKSAVRA